MIKTIFCIWWNPRKAIVDLDQQADTLSNLKIVLGFAVALYVGLGVTLWLRNLFPDPMTLMTAKSLEGLFFSFVLIVATLNTFFYFLSLLLYFLMRALGGAGTINQTKTVVHWAGVSALPIPFFMFTFLGTGVTGEINLLLQIASLFFALVFLVYSFVILTKMLSELHQLHFWKTLAAVCTCFAGTCIGFALIFSFIKFFIL